MPMLVVCSCGKQLTVPETLAGKIVRCPGCQAVFAATPAGSPPPLPSAAAAPIRVRCGSWDMDMQTRAENSGRTVACPRCKKAVQVPGSSSPSFPPALPGVGPAQPALDKHLDALPAIPSHGNIEETTDSPRTRPPFAPVDGYATIASKETWQQGSSGRAASSTNEIPPATELNNLAIPGYEILGELGRGGMGVVYKARQLALKRVVALMMVLDGAHAGAARLARFRAEAEAVAKLQHPNIVQVYEVGEVGGRPYFSLEFVEGGSLDRKVKGTTLPPREAAALVEKMARAMHVVHQQGIVHRDLKPANVLLTADGTPKITDFGLAKDLGSASGQTASGAVMGTPSYMAPEQAGGKAEEIGPLSDVYALGAILYELLVGRPPYKGATVMETLLQVTRDEPVAPSLLVAKVPAELETICLKCLEKAPRKRYESAEHLAMELRRYLNGEPILARPITAWQRGVKWSWRNPAVAGLLLAVMLTLTSGVATASFFAIRAANRAEEANQARQVAADRAEETGRALTRVTAEQEKTQKALDAEKAALERSQKAEKSASEQRGLALQTMKDVVSKIDARLKNRPDLQNLRKELLNQAKEGLSKVARAADTAGQIDHQTIWVHIELGDILLVIDGTTTEAKKQYELAHTLAKRLAAADPSNASAQRDLSVSLERIGDVQEAQGDLKGALASYQECLKLSQQLAAADPSNASAQRVLSSSHHRIGNLLTMQGNVQGAQASYQEGLKINRQLAAADPSNANAQRDLSVSHGKIGEVQLAQEDLRGRWHRTRNA